MKTELHKSSNPAILATACGRDVAEKNSIRDAVNQAVDAYGRIAVLINATFCSIGGLIHETQ